MPLSFLFKTADIFDFGRLHVPKDEFVCAKPLPLTQACGHMVSYQEVEAANREARQKSDARRHLK